MNNLKPKLYVVNCSVFDWNSTAGRVDCKNNMDEETHPFVMFIVCLAIECFLLCRGASGDARPSHMTNTKERKYESNYVERTSK